MEELLRDGWGGVVCRDVAVDGGDVRGLWEGLRLFGEGAEGVSRVGANLDPCGWKKRLGGSYEMLEAVGGAQKGAHLTVTSKAGRRGSPSSPPPHCPVEWYVRGLWTVGGACARACGRKLEGGHGGRHARVAVAQALFARTVQHADLGLNPRHCTALLDLVAAGKVSVGEYVKAFGPYASAPEQFCAISYQKSERMMGCPALARGKQASA